MEHKTYITKSANATKKLGEETAREVLKSPLRETATILALSGNLGGGKTTFLQGFAKGLGVKEKILSPTFVIYKKFKIRSSNVKSSSLNSAELQRAESSGSKSEAQKFENFYHFDCYRINKPEEILELGFKEIILNPLNIVAIEWSEKIRKVLPKSTIFINFKFIDEDKREIKFKI